MFKSNSNLDNYIKYFKRKGVLYINDSGVLQVVSSIDIPKEEKEVELTFNFTFNEE